MRKNHAAKRLNQKCPFLLDHFRADIKAKGIWKDGQWTIEFGRLLVTGNGDDIPFDIKQSYQFGVSRHEIAGLEEDPEAEQPKFGMGDISENLTLKFSH